MVVKLQVLEGGCVVVARRGRYCLDLGLQVGPDVPGSALRRTLASDSLPRLRCTEQTHTFVGAIQLSPLPFTQIIGPHR